MVERSDVKFELVGDLCRESDGEKVHVCKEELTRIRSSKSTRDFGEIECGKKGERLACFIAVIRYLWREHFSASRKTRKKGVLYLDSTA